MPFPLSKEKSFYDSLNDWIGDTLYDDLTEKGFECRDEQIFMAFQIEKALKEKKVLFAEAGVGTGRRLHICFQRLPMRAIQENQHLYHVQMKRSLNS